MMSEFELRRERKGACNSIFKVVTGLHAEHKLESEDKQLEAPSHISPQPPKSYQGEPENASKWGKSFIVNCELRFD